MSRLTSEIAHRCGTVPGFREEFLAITERQIAALRAEKRQAIEHSSPYIARGVGITIFLTAQMIYLRPEGWPWLLLLGVVGSLLHLWPSRRLLLVERLAVELSKAAEEVRSLPSIPESPVPTPGPKRGVSSAGGGWTPQTN